MVDIVNIHEAKTHLSRLLERVASGETITIARAGRPIADLVPHAEQAVRIGTLKGEIIYDDGSFGEIDTDIQRLFYGDDAAS